MQLNYQNVLSYVSGADAKACYVIDQQTSFPIQEAERIRQVKLRSPGLSSQDRDYWLNWDGRHHLFSSKTGAFPSGLVKPVVMALQASGINPEVVDNRRVPGPATVHTPFKTDLRDYQTEAVYDLIVAGRGLLHGATGSGKTVIGLNLIHRLGLPTRILCPNLAVITEWVNKAKEFLDLKIGVFSGREKTWEPVTAISVQSAYRLWKKRLWQTLEKLMYCDLLLVDEVHHGAADSYYHTMMMCSAYYRFGFSGTVDRRSDKEDMLYHAAIGDTVHRITSSSLIENGWLTRPHIVFQHVEDRFIPRSNYRQAVLLGLLHNKQRNDLGAGWAMKLAREGRTILVLVTFIEHGRIMQAIMPNSIFVSGEDNTLPAQREENRALRKSRREEVVEDFAAGRIPILIATRQLLGEGVDVSRIGAIILMGGGKSEVRAIQEVGRGLRKYGGKEEVIIIDFADQMPYLRDHAFERARTWAEEPAFTVDCRGTWIHRAMGNDI